MNDFLSRLNQEKTELEEKTIKLGDFINSEKFKDLSKVHRCLLSEQQEYMINYLKVLTQRLLLLEK